MRKLLLLFIFTQIIALVSAQVSITVNVGAPGGLSSAITAVGGNLSTITNLTVTGIIDARDFKFICDNISNLSILDLGDVQILGYIGSDGTYVNSTTYLANQLPGHAFCNSTTGVGKRSLTSVTLPATTTSIGDNAFSDCAGLSSLIIPSTVTSIGGYVFYNCKALGLINIPENVTSFGNSPFRSCTANLTVSPANSQFIVEDGVLFNSNKSTLIEYQYNKTGAYTIPSSVTTISTNAFTDCTNLTSIVIPSSVVTINTFAFAFCTGLTTVTIPSTLKTLGWFAFSGCIGLTSVYSYMTSPSGLSYTINPFIDVNKNLCTLYVPQGLAASYRSTTPWNYFSNIIEMKTTDVQIFVGENKTKIYPNPTTESFCVSGIHGSVALTLMNIDGKVVLTKQISCNENISVSSLPKGLYVVKLLSDDGDFEQKIVKK